ncbi:MAG: hypothetical protein ISN29_06110 [Gammaproteobacteria bacterium AqS3]|nr:hypothetical protein [Gammaproteobacteria bacterium AqS3]
MLNESHPCSIVGRAEQMAQNRERLAFYQSPLTSIASEISTCITRNGRLLISGCARSQFAVDLLVQLMRGYGQRIRPPLPAVSLRPEDLNEAALDAQARPQDYLLLLWSNADPASSERHAVLETLARQQFSYACIGCQIKAPQCQSNLLVRDGDVEVLVLLLTTLTVMLEASVLGLHQEQ